MSNQNDSTSGSVTKKDILAKKKEYEVPTISFEKNKNYPNGPKMAVFVRPSQKHLVDINIKLTDKTHSDTLENVKTQKENPSSGKKGYVVPTISFPKNSNYPDNPHVAVFNRPTEK
ncbi:unnamed protein product [Caenorhabditis angaria]|uniref:Uncharacterized protein n=1 Tax=Caenorhabditis angaria TaxID=860376 RepID=A0A9P1N8N0_9PELO|nr:unnamed protein product [Caenorhabditis angaria]